MSKLKKLSDSDSEMLMSKLCINSYDWNNFKSFEEKISNLIKKNELLDLIKLSDIDFNSSSDLKTKINQIAELAYGSYPIQLKMKLDSQQDKESLIKWIGRRNTTIHKIVKSPILSKDK